MTTLTTATGSYAIRRIRYTVESASVPGRTYTVEVTDDGWACDCKASQYTKTRGKCWHLKAAQNGEAGKPHIRVMPLPN